MKNTIETQSFLNFCILEVALGSGQRLLYRLGSGLGLGLGLSPVSTTRVDGPN